MTNQFPLLAAHLRSLVHAWLTADRQLGSARLPAAAARHYAAPAAACHLALAVVVARCSAAPVVAARHVANALVHLAPAAAVAAVAAAVAAAAVVAPPLLRALPRPLGLPQSWQPSLGSPLPLAAQTPGAE